LRENQFGECSFSSEINLPFFEADKCGMSRSCICPSKEHIRWMQANDRRYVDRWHRPADVSWLGPAGERRDDLPAASDRRGNACMGAGDGNGAPNASPYGCHLPSVHARASFPSPPSPRGLGRTSHGPTRGDAWKTKKILLTNAADTGTTVPPVHSFHCRPAAS
jgi:hypothetical protein